MHLQIAGFDRNHAVVCGMALVKSIMREGFPMVKDTFSSAGLDAIFNRAFDEFIAVFFDFLDFLFGNSRTQVVRFAGSVACELNRGNHDLFLIDRVSVGFAQDRLQLFVLVGDRFFAVHIGDVFGYAFHWTRAVKRDHGNHVVNGFRLHLLQIAGHAVAFQLEETDRVTLADELEHVGFINWNAAKG